jgi:hypothetical protein
MTHRPGYSLQGNHIMIDNETGKWFVSHIEDNRFRDAIANLYDYIVDNTADVDNAYDWVCEKADISTFVADTYAWNMFYDVYEQATA